MGFQCIRSLDARVLLFAFCRLPKLTVRIAYAADRAQCIRHIAANRRELALSYEQAKDIRVLISKATGLSYTVGRSDTPQYAMLIRGVLCLANNPELRAGVKDIADDSRGIDWSNAQCISSAERLASLLFRTAGTLFKQELERPGVRPVMSDIRERVKRQHLALEDKPEKPLSDQLAHRGGPRAGSAPAIYTGATNGAKRPRRQAATITTAGAPALTSEPTVTADASKDTPDVQKTETVAVSAAQTTNGPNAYAGESTMDVCRPAACAICKSGAIGRAALVDLLAQGDPAKATAKATKAMIETFEAERNAFLARSVTEQERVNLWNAETRIYKELEKLYSNVTYPG